MENSKLFTEKQTYIDDQLGILSTSVLKLRMDNVRRQLVNATNLFSDIHDLVKASDTHELLSTKMSLLAEVTTLNRENSALRRELNLRGVSTSYPIFDLVCLSLVISSHSSTEGFIFNKDLTYKVNKIVNHILSSFKDSGTEISILTYGTERKIKFITIMIENTFIVLSSHLDNNGNFISFSGHPIPGVDIYEY